MGDNCRTLRRGGRDAPSDPAPFGYGLSDSGGCLTFAGLFEIMQHTNTVCGERIVMKRCRALLLPVLLLGGVAGAQVVGAKYAGEFMAIGVGGRALAMGGASVAVVNDVTAGYWNPAALARIEYPQLILMHDEQFGSLANHDYGAIALPFGSNASLGLSVIRLGVDDIAETRYAGVDINGNPTNDINQFSRVDPNRVTYFNAADWAVYFTYAKRHADNFFFGANLKVIRRDIGDYGAWGVGFDIGAWYAPVQDLSLGINIQDITTTLLAWDTGRNELIRPTVKLGSAYALHALSGRFLPAVDVDVRFENRQSASMVHVGPVSADFHAGLEYQFKELFALRVGYSDVKQLTLGAGLHLPKINIDYSFVKFDARDQLGNTHRVSLIFTLESDRYKRSND